MGCHGRGCLNRRRNGNSVTFGRTGPTAVGNVSKTFDRSLSIQGAFGRGKTIQTNDVNRNNMGQEPCCVGGPPPPPCPQEPEQLFCTGTGLPQADLSSFCSGFASQWFFDQKFTTNFGNDGGSIAADAGIVHIAANPWTIAPANFAQIVGNAPIINPATDTFCVCFDVHANYVDARTWEGGISQALSNVSPTQKIVVTPAVGGFLLFFNAGISFLTGVVPVSPVPGQHSFRICHDAAAPDVFTLQVDGGTAVSFTVPLAAIPAIALPASIAAFETAPSTLSSVIESSSYCAQWR